MFAKFLFEEKPRLTLIISKLIKKLKIMVFLFLF